MPCQPPVQNVLFMPLRSKPLKPLPAKGYKLSKRQQKNSPTLSNRSAKQNCRTLGTSKKSSSVHSYHCTPLLTLGLTRGVHIDTSIKTTHVAYGYTHNAPFCNEPCSFSILMDRLKYFSEGWEKNMMVRALTFLLSWKGPELLLKTTG